MTKANLNIQARKMLKAAKLYCTSGRMAILKVLIEASQAPFELGNTHLDRT